MANLIKCPCCGKEISEDSINCINCGEPINIEKPTLLFAYEYEGKTINSPLYRDELYKLDVLQKVKKVELYNKTYKITDFICNASDETVYVILDDDN